MRARTGALLGSLALLLSACGSSASSSISASGSGRDVFTRDCSFCHSLSGQSSPKQQGGDLLRAGLRRPVLAQFTVEMPVRHRLTKRELNAVVDYVLAVQRRAGR